MATMSDDAVLQRNVREEATRSRTLWLDRAKLRSELGAKAFRSVGEGLRHLRDAERILVIASLRAA